MSAHQQATGHDPYKPTINFDGGLSINVTPVQLAEGFWSLDSEGMADFFAALNRRAGVMLCFQMAAVVGEIADRAERDDHDAMHGFQTMLSHAQDFAEGAASHRGSKAMAEISRIAGQYRRGVPA